MEKKISRALEEKCSDLRRIGDVQLLNNIQDVGVALFYHMTYLFTEEAASYPPLKQLITTCVETLGQVRKLVNFKHRNVNREHVNKNNFVP